MRLVPELRAPVVGQQAAPQPHQRAAASVRLGKQGDSTMTVQRIPYGEEEGFWGEIANQQPCHDCGVAKGAYHIPGCDAEKCPTCRNMAGHQGQLISCGCYDVQDGTLLLPKVNPAGRCLDHMPCNLQMAQAFTEVSVSRCPLCALRQTGG